MNNGIILAAAFVFVGLLVVFVAMRGGPRSALKPTEPTRGTRRVTTIGVVVVVIGMGVVAPILILGHNEDERSNAAPGGKQLTASEREGRQLFARSCATCHTLDDSGSVGKVGPDLDVLRPQASLTVNAIIEGRARGQGQMPRELLNGEDAENVAKYVARVAGR